MLYEFEKVSRGSIQSLPDCDIRKMQGKKPFYRLRVGDNRFLYVIIGNDVLVG